LIAGSASLEGMNGASSRNAQFHSDRPQRWLNGQLIALGAFAWVTGCTPCIR
jgi:hypothetical protein